MPISENNKNPRAGARACEMSLLTLNGIVAGYGGGNVLQGVDIDVESGSVTCIVGPNGAGKSTVLRAISGLLRPSAGSIEFDGQGLVDMSCAQILKAGIVQVPQHDALFGSMTVKENVMLGGYLLRRDRALLKRRYAMVEELIPLVRERPQEKAGNLSGGQRRMIEIGRTLMLQPALILMDEPSLGLEPRAVKQVSDLISSANREGRTILLVEQNVRLGFKMATHGIIMESGRVRTTGAPRSLLDDPELADLYLGGASGDATSERSVRRPPEQTGHG
jgi:ABC-type branched-subunit amino acid transport system ATPase component